MLSFTEELAITFLLALGGAGVAAALDAAGWSFKALFLCFLALGLVLQGLWDMLIWPFAVNPLRRVASPKSKSRFNVSTILMDSPRGSLPLQWMRAMTPAERAQGLLHIRNLFNTSVLLPTSALALQDVLGSRTYDFEKPWKVRAFMARVLGFGLVLSEGNAHRVQRRALTPAFSVRHIRALYGLMWEKTGVLLGELEREINAHPDPDPEQKEGSQSAGKVEMSVWASRLTLDIIGPVAMGRDFQSLLHHEHKVADSFLALLQPSHEMLVFLAVNYVLPQWLSRRIPWHLNRMMDGVASFLRSVCLDIVREKRVALQTRKPETELEADILGTIMLRGEFSDDELVDQMLTFLAAGHETTASALTWICYVLCKHPDVQTRLREEIHAAIPSADYPVTWTQLESLPLLNGVCQEVLRLYPTIPATVRETVRDTTIANTPVPRGTRVMLCPYAINRSPEFWGETGDQFIPERWFDNHHGGAPTNYAQLTFLHGPRSCIGKDFARAELRCAVAGLVGRFVLEMQHPGQELHVEGAVTTKPREGLHLRMKRVEW